MAPSFLQETCVLYTASIILSAYVPWGETFGYTANHIKCELRNDVLAPMHHGHRRLRSDNSLTCVIVTCEIFLTKCTHAGNVVAALSPFSM